MSEQPFPESWMNPMCSVVTTERCAMPDECALNGCACDITDNQVTETLTDYHDDDEDVPLLTEEVV